MFDELQRSLPERDVATTRNESDFYGASHLIARQLGWTEAPTPGAAWMHGWIFWPQPFVESFTWDADAAGPCVLTHRGAEADFLRKSNFPAAVAVGAPFLYVPEPPVTRVPRSLLIMPMHSLAETSHACDERQYFEALDPVLDRFDHVVASLHGSCVEKGLWVESLRQRNIPYLTGANLQDRNALVRMRQIFASFSHVTSNWIGSHMAYAAASGCSFSIFGPTPEFRASDYEKHPHYQKHPHILENLMGLIASGYVQTQFAGFFREPDVTSDDREWAAAQLGKANMRSPEELARLFRWRVEPASAPPREFFNWAPRLGWNAPDETGELLKTELNAARVRMPRMREKVQGLQAEVKQLRRELRELRRPAAVTPSQKPVVSGPGPSPLRRLIRRIVTLFAGARSR